MKKPAARGPQGSKRSQATKGRKTTKLADKSDQELLKELKKLIVRQVKQTKIKASVSDFVKLVQLEKDLTDGSAQEIEARWVDPPSADER
jgi:hypothetical protein